MKLVVLGTAGYHPNEYRQTTCVTIPEAGIVFDAGTSFFRLPRYIETDAIDIFLTHAHLDHVVGLTYLLDILYQRPTEVRVHGEPDKLRAVREHLFSPEIFPVEPPYTEVPIADRVSVGDAKITHCPLEHPGGSLAYRVDWPDRSLAFVTDTTAARDAAYVEFIRGVDLLIHECNFADGLDDLAKTTGHSCLTPVVELAKQAEVGGMVLLHFNPLIVGLEESAIAEAQKIFSPIVLAEDGMEIDF